MRKAETWKIYRFPGPMLVIVAGAFLLRVFALDARPMHCDEAVHAYKTGILLETGRYEYNPREYHGPVLYYCSLPLLWLRGANTHADFTESVLRFVPVLFGSALVVLLWPLRKVLGSKECLAAGLLTALSPAMVFYSRYYIQEMALVFFTFSALVFAWRYLRTGKGIWAAVAGAFFGAMYATKETCVIAWTALAVAAIATRMVNRWRNESRTSPRPAYQYAHLGAASASALIVAFLFLSGFLTHVRGAWDSLGSYAFYLNRAGVVGAEVTSASIAIDAAHHHYHPWYFYLKMLLFSRYGPGPWWSEAFILILAVAGGVSAFADGRSGERDHSFVRFLALYTLVTILIYSAIPYKTPWVMLGFLHGLILLAAVGVVSLFRRFPSRAMKAVIGVLLILGAVHLGSQAWLASYRFDCDPRNPYVYAHTSRDLIRLADRMEALAIVHPEGRDLLIKIVTDDYWPLPWYLRGFGRVGYWDRVPEAPDADVVICKPDFEEQMDARLRDAYQKEYFGLRPEVLLTAYIRSDLWHAFLRERM